MKILVTFALETEFAPWRAMHEFRAARWSEGEVQVTNIAGARVGVLLTGMGPERAGAALSSVIRSDSESISACISSGLAGGLRPEYRAAQILAAKSIYSDRLRKNFPARSIECSASLVSLAADHGATIANQFYTAAQIVATGEEKRALGQDFDAVEMESFEIVLEGLALGIPTVAIRGISDSVGDNLPIDMNEVFADDGSVSVRRVIGVVARHPQAIPGLVRLGKNSRKATEALAHFLNSYVEALATSNAELSGKATVNAR